MFDKILVAYDGSPSSRSALEAAYELALNQDAQATVLTVAPTVAPLVGLAPVNIDELSQELEQWASRTAQEAAAGAPDGLTVETVERSGHIGEEIVAEIESGRYDLVVLGSRGHGRLVCGACRQRKRVRPLPLEDSPARRELAGTRRRSRWSNGRNTGIDVGPILTCASRVELQSVRASC